jgi:HEPN domain-containing protein
MKVDEATVAEVREWLMKAKNDLDAVEWLLSAPHPLVSPASFHIQQAVEKSMKTFLTWHSIPFRKTHDLTELGHLCLAIDPSLREPLQNAARLTEYAWRYRYPGEPLEPDLEELQDDITIGKALMLELFDRLPKELRFEIR